MVTFAGNEFLSFYTDYVDGTNRFIVIGVQQWGYGNAGFPITPQNFLACWETAGVNAYAVIRLNEKPPFYSKTGWIAICW